MSFLGSIHVINHKYLNNTICIVSNYKLSTKHKMTSGGEVSKMSQCTDLKRHNEEGGFIPIFMV